MILMIIEQPDELLCMWMGIEEDDTMRVFLKLVECIGPTRKEGATSRSRESIRTNKHVERIHSAPVAHGLLIISK
jgi:hypothetical protein